MQVTIQISDDLAIQARCKGVPVEVYVQQLLDEKTNGERTQKVSNEVSPRNVSEAVDSIRELRKGNKLNGLKIKDLINEGRKY